jgi:hypothetical protein
LRNLSIAAASFLIGSAPFIAYNLHKPNATLGENAIISGEQLSDKVEAARRTFNSHAIFTYIVLDDWVTPARAPQGKLEQASLALRNAAGASQKNEMLWAYALAILLSPLAWRTGAFRPMLFALIFCLVGWGLMLVTKGAGASVHHVILLWPMPLVFLALAFAEASQRLPAKISAPVLCVVVGFFAAKNILVTNEYLAQFIRNGPTAIWTNALFPLSDDLMQSHYSQIDGIDWGMTVPLQVLERAQVPIDFLNVDENAPQRVLDKMAKRDVLFLGHARNWTINGQPFPIEVFAGVDDRMDAIARKNGLVKQIVKTFNDGNGRPVFELFQYHPQ